MSVLVVFAGKAFVVVGTVGYWTLFWSLGLMGEHMGFEVFEWSATVWMRTSRSFFAILIESIPG